MSNSYFGGMEWMGKLVIVVFALIFLLLGGSLVFLYTSGGPPRVCSCEMVKNRECLQPGPSPDPRM